MSPDPRMFFPVDRFGDADASAQPALALAFHRQVPPSLVTIARIAGPRSGHWDIGSRSMLAM